MAHRVAADVDVELDDIWLYTARQSGSFEIADKVVDTITHCFILLGRNPYMGRRRDHDLSPGLRTFPTGNYVIVYRTDDGDPATPHFIHASRDIESFLHH